MNRRFFLKLVGMGSISIAAGCTPDPYNQPRPDKTLYSLVQAPDDMVTGDAAWYASTCRECPAGCGILAKNREGRVIKVEGNPHHPINRGRLCMRGQAALQGEYNPDRIRTPLLKENGHWKPITFTAALSILNDRAGEAAKAGPDRVRMVTEVVGESLLGLFETSLAHWASKGPLVFEPFAYESLKLANQAAFGIEGLPSYRLDEADVLVSLGADFLETWLSPVEYARKFKTMHAISGGRKGRFFHVGPYQSVTAANADLWLSCRPGSEAVLALALTADVLNSERATSLPRVLRDDLKNFVAGLEREKAIEVSGVSANGYERLSQSLLSAEKPLVLGSASIAGPNALQADFAANLLNLALNPELPLIDFERRHRVEVADSRSDLAVFFRTLQQEAVDVLLLNNVNPVYALAGSADIAAALKRETPFTVAFSNFMDETAALADLVIPTAFSLESWDEYGGTSDAVSTLQPAMGRFIGAPHIGDVFMKAALGKTAPENTYKTYLIAGLISRGLVRNESDWLKTLQRGGIFEANARSRPFDPAKFDAAAGRRLLASLSEPAAGLTFLAAPSLRFFDGRGANRPWLCEIPDPLTRVAWQAPVLLHPDTAKTLGLKQGDLVRVSSGSGQLEAPVYVTPGVRPQVAVMALGQGHVEFGRYAAGRGSNPVALFAAEDDGQVGMPRLFAEGVQIAATGRVVKLANTDGDRTQHGRKIAASVAMESLASLKQSKLNGLTMWDFPLTLPLPEGYDPKRDFYKPHDHDGYRWGMVVDLDRCVGCGACAAACYAENNIAVVGGERIVEGREMAWLSVERYVDAVVPEKITFLPLMCQHCDNAPCESVCPVYAPHHNKEGMNNQIYNRCIGTRFCSQNCPYKVRRFNWFAWEWPEPMQLQLNPNVTVRAKGVMEKCSFCVQRIKEAHNWAKNEKRTIRDGEIVPACVQTCPTDALVFGSLMDPDSRVRKMVDDPRAYQIMGYLNTKPGVIYLKKVVQEV